MGSKKIDDAKLVREENFRQIKFMKVIEIIFLKGDTLLLEILFQGMLLQEQLKRDVMLDME